MPFQGCAIPGLCHASWQHRSLGTDTQQLPPAPSSASCRLVSWETSPLPHGAEIHPGIHSSFGQGEEVGRRGNAESVLRERGQRVPELPWLRVKPLPGQGCCCAQPLLGSGQAGRLLGAAGSWSQQILHRDTVPRLETASRSHLRCGTEVKAGENSRALKTQGKFMGGLENPGATKHKI